MIRISHQREKCIGCNYCVELAFERWRMSKKDGKVTLIDGKNKKGFYTAIVGDDEYDVNISAVKVCPVKIIRVEKVK